MTFLADWPVLSLYSLLDRTVTWVWGGISIGSECGVMANTVAKTKKWRQVRSEVGKVSITLHLSYKSVSSGE